MFVRALSYHFLKSAFHRFLLQPGNDVHSETILIQHILLHKKHTAVELHVRRKFTCKILINSAVKGGQTQIL